jgi:ribonuclease-3
MLHDYKSQLQEEIQAENREAVEYVVVKESGPSHDKVFEVEVRLENLTLGKGVGKSKKEAEQSAAKDALSKRVK